MSLDRRTFLKGAGIGGSALLAGCTSLTTSGSGTVKIGFNAPLTGFASADGQSAKQGAKLAESIINSNGGIDGRDVKVLIQDDAAAADEAVPIVKQFINKEQVDFGVSGSYSTPTRAIAPIYNDNEIPFVSSYATNPEITQGKYTFRTGIWAPLHGKVGAYIAAEKLDASSAAVLTVDNDFGHTISDQFKKSAPDRDIEVLYETKYPLGEDNFRSTLNSIKDKGPDLLYATGYYAEAANIVKQAQEIGLDAQIMGEEGYDSPKFFELGGDAASGTIITTNLNRGSDLEATKTFISEYEDEWGMQADMVAANCYDAVRLCAKAGNDVGSTDSGAIIDDINGLKNWEGAATGPIREFMGPGEAVRPIAVQQAEGGKWTEYAEVTQESLITPDV